MMAIVTSSSTKVNPFVVSRWAFFSPEIESMGDSCGPILSSPEESFGFYTHQAGLLARGSSSGCAFQAESPWHHATFVSTYSGGSARDSHPLPVSSTKGYPACVLGFHYRANKAKR